MRAFIEFVEEFERISELAAEDNVKILLDQYGDWISELDDMKTLKHLEKLLTLIGDVRRHFSRTSSNPICVRWARPLSSGSKLRLI